MYVYLDIFKVDCIWYQTLRMAPTLFFKKCEMFLHKNATVLQLVLKNVFSLIDFILLWFKFHIFKWISIVLNNGLAPEKQQTNNWISDYTAIWPEWHH